MKKRKSKQRRKEAVGVVANYNFWKRHTSPHVERVDLDSLSLNAKGQLRYVFLSFFSFVWFYLQFPPLAFFYLHLLPLPPSPLNCVYLSRLRPATRDRPIIFLHPLR